MDNSSTKVEREQFEAWSNATWKYNLRPANPDSADTYMEGETETAWMGWEARAALKAQPAPTDPVAYQKRYPLQSGGMGAWQPASKAAYDSRAENQQIGFRALYADQPAPTEAQGDDGITASGFPATIADAKFAIKSMQNFVNTDPHLCLLLDDNIHTLRTFVHSRAEAALGERVANKQAQGEINAAAVAVVARWDSPKWKDEPHTAVFIDRLRKALQPSGNAGELVQGEDSARLDWSSEQAPNSECGYHHVTAQTPFGRILITWKGWKDYPSPTVDEHPIDGYFYVGDDVSDAKKNAERAYFEAIDRARASAETGGVKS